MKSAVTSILLFCIAVWGQVIRVPDDVLTIQQAIDIATINDEIILADGIYQGVGNVDLIIEGSSGIVIKGENGPANCIIDCQGSEQDPHIALSVNSSFNTLEGLTIKNSFNTTDFCAAVSILSDATDNLIRNCIFENNGAIQGPAAIYYEESVKISGCLFADNYYTSEPYNSIMYSVIGGLTEFIDGVEPFIEYCTFVDNKSLPFNMFSPVYGYVTGDALFSNKCINAYNCIIWGLDLSLHYRPELQEYIDDKLLERNCFIDGLSDDPKFVDYEGGDYMLRSDSPCIDYSVEFPSSRLANFDLAGTSRFVGLRADIGAFEYYNDQDFNIDGYVDNEDFAIFSDRDEFFIEDLVELANSWIVEKSNIPLVHWKFDTIGSSKVLDSLGRNNASLYGGAKTVKDAEKGTVLYLDGIDDYLEADEYQGPEIGHNISFWFKTEVQEYEFDKKMTVFWWGKPDTPNIWKLWYTPAYCYDDGRSCNPYTASFILQTNKEEFTVYTDIYDNTSWHYVEMRVPYNPDASCPEGCEKFNEFHFPLYVDNVYQGCFEVLSDSCIIPERKLLLGRSHTDVNTNYFNGYIDDVKITNRYDISTENIYNKYKEVVKLELDSTDSYYEDIRGNEVVMFGNVRNISLEKSSQYQQNTGLYFNYESSCYIEVDYEGITGMDGRVVYAQVNRETRGTIVCWGEPEPGERFSVAINDDGYIEIAIHSLSKSTIDVYSYDEEWIDIFVILPNVPLPTLNDVIVIAGEELYMPEYGDYYSDYYDDLIINTASGTNVIIGAKVTETGMIDYLRGPLGKVVIAEDLTDVYMPELTEMTIVSDSLDSSTWQSRSPQRQSYIIHNAIPLLKEDPVMGGYFEFGEDNGFLLDNEGVLNDDPRTVTGWIRTEDVEGHIVCWGTPGSNGSKWFIRTDEGKLRVEIGSNYIVGDHFISDNNWHHFAVVQEQSHLALTKIYIDGNLDSISKSSFSGGVINTVISGIEDGFAAKVFIAGYYEFFDYQINQLPLIGDLKYIEIYSRALSKDEIYEKYIEYGQNLQ